MTESNLPSVAPPPAAPARRGGIDSTARVLGVCALALAVVTAWLAWEVRSSSHAIEASAGSRIAELGQESAQSRAALGQVQAALRESQGRLAELEGHVAETQEQRVALEEMYRDLARSADDRVLSEVEQMLVLASQQLQLAGNVRGALAALQAADQRLARAEKLAATPLRRAISSDIERLKAVPQPDTVGIAVKLDGLMSQVDALPLIISETAPQRTATRWREPADSALGRAARDFWDEMKGLVRIRDMEMPDIALLAPEQAYFLRENLKLRLLSARVALLARDESSFREDVHACQVWMSKYFDTKAKPAALALGTLKQLAESPVNIAVPDINASLAAVRTARAARERS
jgi:uroporphyrin-III C-methyltransferase